MTEQEAMHKAMHPATHPEARVARSERYELWHLEQATESNPAAFEWMVFDFYKAAVAQWFESRGAAEDWMEGRGE